MLSSLTSFHIVSWKMVFFQESRQSKTQFSIHELERFMLCTLCFNCSSGYYSAEKSPSVCLDPSPRRWYKGALLHQVYQDTEASSVLLCLWGLSRVLLSERCLWEVTRWALRLLVEDCCLFVLFGGIFNIYKLNQSFCSSD